MTDTSDESSGASQFDPDQTYQRLVAYHGAESVHDLIARDGIEILDRKIPYLVQRLRWLNLDTAKRSRREIPVETGFVEARLSFDPVARIADSAHLGSVLAELEPSDLSVLWWAAAGLTGVEQLQQWIDAKYEPTNLTEAGLRKRLSRARKKLREALSED